MQMQSQNALLRYAMNAKLRYRLASLSGLRQSTLDNIAKGNTRNPTIRTLHRIAVGLNMTVSELLNFDAMNESIFDDE